METVPLADCDLRWVFPELVDEPRVLDVRWLHRTAGRSSRDARPSWTRCGLEFHRFPGQQTAILSGCAETIEVSLIAELCLPKDPIEWMVTGSPPRLVNAEISVRCDAPVDCGMHAIETS